MWPPDAEAQGLGEKSGGPLCSPAQMGSGSFLPPGSRTWGPGCVPTWLFPCCHGGHPGRHPLLPGPAAARRLVSKSTTSPAPQGPDTPAQGLPSPRRGNPRASRGRPANKHRLLLDKGGLFLPRGSGAWGERDSSPTTQSHSAQRQGRFVRLSLPGGNGSRGDLPSPAASRGHPTPPAGPPRS